MPDYKRRQRLSAGTAMFPLKVLLIAHTVSVFACSTRAVRAQRPHRPIAGVAREL